MTKYAEYFAFKIDTAEFDHGSHERASAELLAKMQKQGISGVWSDPYLQYEAFLFPDRESMIVSYRIAVELGFSTAGIIPMKVKA